MKQLLHADHKVRIIMYFLRHESGFALFGGTMAAVQTLSMSLFFSGYFGKSLSRLSLDTDTHFALSWTIGIAFAAVVESGVFFFAVNAMRVWSAVFAVVSGTLSVAAWLSSHSGEWAISDFIALPVIALVPATYLLVISHELAKKYEASDFDTKVMQSLSDTPTEAKQIDIGAIKRKFG